jgi:hypothetical protein
MIGGGITIVYKTEAQCNKSLEAQISNIKL